jgi:hypothetical protein
MFFSGPVSIFYFLLIYFYILTILHDIKPEHDSMFAHVAVSFKPAVMSNFELTITTGGLAAQDLWRIT